MPDSNAPVLDCRCLHEPFLWAGQGNQGSTLSNRQEYIHDGEVVAKVGELSPALARREIEVSARDRQEVREADSCDLDPFVLPRGARCEHDVGCFAVLGGRTVERMSSEP